MLAQAKTLAAYKLLNSAHVCASPQVLVTCRNWPQRREFLNLVRKALAQAPQARCFYPGAERSYRKHLDAAGGQALGDAEWAPIFQEGVRVPETGVGAETLPLGFEEEAFCPVLYEVAIDSPAEVGSFMAKAVTFCHKHCWGSLTCTVVIDDRTKAQHAEEFDGFLDTMRFGTIGVNVPPANANIIPSLTWGAFPGNDARDVRSGIGQLGNFACYQNVEKSILSSRFSNLSCYMLSESLHEQARARRRAESLASVFSKMSYARLGRFVGTLLRDQPSEVLRSLPNQLS